MRRIQRRFKLVYGVGINDADYNVYEYDGPINNKKIVWVCPFYVKWKDVLARCYSEKFQVNCPTYIGCSTPKEWHKFSNFKSWMETQDWENKHLDKDILYRGNKIYSPETCVFVDQKINKFLTEGDSNRGPYPIGVSFHKASGKFIAQCNQVVNDKRKHLGLFSDPQEAHQAWLSYKLEQAYILASEQTDERIAKALIARYESYDVEST